MKDINLFFTKNLEKVYSAKFNPITKRIDIKLRDKRVDGTALNHLLKIFSGIIEIYGRLHPPIFLDFTNIEFADKLTYITLECILYCMITEYHFDILINLSGENRITASGWPYSPLISLTHISKEKRREFVNNFDFMLNRNHYRRVIKLREDKSYVSNVFDDICCFILNSSLDLDEKCVDEIAGVIAELISNGIEHGNQECLVDVDIAGGFYDERDMSETRKEYLGLGVAVVNLSSKCIGEDLKRKMTSELRNNLPDRYNYISKALVNHSAFFDDNYFEEDFYNIAIFQNNISGRYDTSKSGGTGMLKLVKALSDRSQGDNCYLLSGKRIVQFQNEHMIYDDNGWIGFNEDNDFCQKKPSDGVIKYCDMFFPGVAYNLQFIMERGNDEKDNY